MLEREDYENDKPIEVAYDEFAANYKDMFKTLTPTAVKFIFSEGWKAHKHYIDVKYGDDGK